MAVREWGITFAKEISVFNGEDKQRLKRGMAANITILEVQKGPRQYCDAFGVPYMGDTFILPRTTIISGRVMYNTIETDF